MDGIVYHASKTEGLTELDPSKSQHQATHGKKFLYASSSKELAMFMSARITDLYSATAGQGTIENPAILVERLPGIFDKFLHQPTTIYLLDAQDFYQGTQWEGEVVTEKKQEVLSEENISDIYSELKKLEETGTVKMYHYPDRPPEISKDNSDLIENMMLPIYRAKEDFGIVRTMLRTYPKLFPKIMKSLASDPKLFSKVLKKSISQKLKNIKKTINNKLQPTSKKKLLPSGKEKEEIPPKKTPEFENQQDSNESRTDHTKKPWDLANWGIKVEEFREESYKIAQKSLESREDSTQNQNETQVEQKLPGDMSEHTL